MLFVRLETRISITFLSSKVFTCSVFNNDSDDDDDGDDDDDHNNNNNVVVGL